jgi:hypothetical protein
MAACAATEFETPRAPCPLPRGSQSGTWSEADEQQLQTWLAATAEHREAYETSR